MAHRSLATTMCSPTFWRTKNERRQPGVRADGCEELVALADGYREASESCADLLGDCLTPRHARAGAGDRRRGWALGRAARGVPGHEGAALLVPLCRSWNYADAALESLAGHGFLLTFTKYGPSGGWVDAGTSRPRRIGQLPALAVAYTFDDPLLTRISRRGR